MVVKWYSHCSSGSEIDDDTGKHDLLKILVNFAIKITSKRIGNVNNNSNTFAHMCTFSSFNSTQLLEEEFKVLMDLNFELNIVSVYEALNLAIEEFRITKPIADVARVC